MSVWAVGGEWCGGIRLVSAWGWLHEHEERADAADGVDVDGVGHEGRYAYGLASGCADQGSLTSDSDDRSPPFCSRRPQAMPACGGRRGEQGNVRVIRGA